MPNKPFIPTKKQIDLIRVMLDMSVEPTITAFCEEVGINRSTYYDWFDKPEFVEWFNKEWNRALKDKGSWLDRVGLQKSVKDYRYWEAMQKIVRHGGLQDEHKIQLDGDRAGIFASGDFKDKDAEDK